MRLGRTARSRVPCPGAQGLILPILTAFAFLGAPRDCAAITAIVPDDYATVQLGIDSGADTVLVRAGTYAESPLLVASFRPIVLMADPAASPRPTLQGLIVKANHSYEGDRKVVGLRILNTVDIQTGSVSARYDFEACLLEAGVRHLLGQPSYDHAGSATTFVRCTLRGSTYLFVNSLTMESDTVEAGGASFSSSGGGVRVRNSWFRGPTGLYITNTSPLYAEVVGNRFEDCAVGIYVYDDFTSGYYLVDNNVVRNSRDWGIRVRGEYADILRNDIRDSGGGIEAIIFGNSRLIGNTVFRGARAGISINEDAPGPAVDVRDNLVLRCGGGISYVGSDYPDHFFTGNTSALNAGSGFSIAITAYGGASACVVSNNIASGNTGWGLHWSGPGTPALSCNDWFANTAGVVNGTTPGPTDLFTDPFFCDLPNDDVRLSSDSPLVGGACGTIGARGIGCDASTEVLVALFSAEASDHAVSIRWRLGGDEEPVSVSIERSSAQQGPWQAMATERSIEGGVNIDWDRGAEPGRPYWYRLAWTTTDGQQSYSSPIDVQLTSSSPAFTLRAIGPNPASGPVAIEYTLPVSTAINLTIHDLLGREVTRLASGVQTQGHHVTQWTGEARGGRAGPGVYFVRLAYPGGQRSQRILLRR